jgi:hypothetical protein
VKRLLALFLAFAFILPACSSVLPHYAYTRHPYNTEHAKIIPVWVDKNFGQADLILVQSALDGWNYALNGYIKFEIVSSTFDMELSEIRRINTEHGVAILKIDSTSKLIPPANDGDNTVLAFTVGHRWVYMIRDRERDDRMFRGVLLHEEGHTLSAGHISRALHNSLMNPNYSDAYNQCIDYWTMLVVSQMQGLDSTKLNYCTYENESND